MSTAVFDIEADGFLYDSRGDLKGNGKQREATKVFCISIKDMETGKNRLFEPTELDEALEHLSTFDIVSGHNILGYDLPVLEKLLDYKLPETTLVVDTLILSRLRYPFLQSHSLKAWGERAAIRGWIKLGKTEYNNFDYYEPEMGEYCQQDVEVNATVYKHLIKQIDPTQDYVRLEHDIQSIQTRSEQYGVAFDEEAALKLSQKIEQEMNDIYSELEEMLGYAWTEKVHKLKKDGSISHHAVNLLARLDEDFPQFKHEATVMSKECTSSISVPTKVTLDTKKLLVEKLLEMGWKPTMLTDGGSPKIADKGEACPNLPEEFKDVGRYFVLKHRKALVDGFFRHVRVDGTIPSEANTLGAVTGRYTHRKIANLPRINSVYGLEIRDLFRADKERVQVGCDLAGIEARMLAHFMGDDDYTNEVLNGDIHTTNQLAAGLPTRDAAKTFFYGFLYGAGDAKVGLLVGGNANAGKKVKEQFLESLPALKTLIESKQEEAKKGYITSLDSRPIYITKSTGFGGKKQYDARKALNSLLQSSATIFFKRWLWFIEKLCKQDGVDANLMISYHDEVQYSVAEGHVQKFKGILKHALVKTDKYYQTKCPNDIDTKTGGTWADCH